MEGGAEVTPQEEYIIENILLPRMRRITRQLDAFISNHGPVLSNKEAKDYHIARGRDLCARCLAELPVCECRRRMFRNG